ncbi:cytochrome c [bacterium]|nr:cytochrome c [bacterium]
MTRRTAFLIFFFGTLSSAVIFLLLTIDFHRKKDIYTDTSALTEQVVAGKNVWKKYNCNDCHTMLGFGGYYAPDMTKAFFRLGENNIIAIVMHPEEVYKNSFRKMPNLGVTEKEARDLVAFFKWTGNIENRQWPPQDEKYVAAYRMRESAAQVLTKTDIVLGACGGCHAFENQGRDVAGDFNDIAKETTYDRDTLVKLMLDPDSVDPDLGMPAQNVSRETAELIADFILSLK